MPAKRLPICVLSATALDYERWLRHHGLTQVDAWPCIYRDQIQGREFRRVVATDEFWKRNRECSGLYALALTRVREMAA